MNMHSLRNSESEWAFYHSSQEVILWCLIRSVQCKVCFQLSLPNIFLRNLNSSFFLSCHPNGKVTNITSDIRDLFFFPCLPIHNANQPPSLCSAVYSLCYPDVSITSLIFLLSNSFILASMILCCKIEALYVTIYYT
jgi:hypothetical protein